MFLGHLAVGFAAKKAAPKTSLGVLLGAAELIDLLFPAFVLTGLEQVRIEPGGNPFLRLAFHYPLSHSLLATVVWAGAAALLYLLLTRYQRGAVVTGLAVLSHWILDMVSHRPDLPLYPGTSPVAGLGLWYSVAGTLIVEALMFAAGIWVYVAATRARDRRGTYGLWSFVVLMVLLYAASVTGPPPPDASAMAWVGLSFALFFFWAHWFDRHREARA